MTTQVYYTNSCSNDNLDPSCFCYNYGPSGNYKIFDVESGAYVCCGNINFNLNVSGSTPVEVAASLDDPRCLGWWVGSAENFNPSNPPQPGVDFFLPDAGLTNGRMPSSYGPSGFNLQNVNFQGQLNSFFTLPQNFANGDSGTTAMCSSGNIFWLNYQNPNKGAPFVNNMVCFDPARTAELKTNAVYNSGNWALYSTNCDSGSTSSTCISSVGQVIAPPSNTRIGNVVISTPNYTGGTVTPLPVVPRNNGWIVWTIVGLSIFVVVLVILVVYFTFRKKKSKKIVSDDSGMKDINSYNSATIDDDSDADTVF